MEAVHDIQQAMLCGSGEVVLALSEEPLHRRHWVNLQVRKARERSQDIVEYLDLVQEAVS